MWHRPVGDSLLGPKLGRLFRYGVHSLISQWELSMDAESKFEDHTKILNPLKLPERFYVLWYISLHLLASKGAAPELSAIPEAMIGEVFAQLKIETVFMLEASDEIVDDNKLFGRILLEAKKEVFPDGKDLPRDELDEEMEKSLLEGSYSGSDDPSHSVGSRIDAIIDLMAESILWDRDYEFEKLMDKNPDEANVIKDFAGIERDYYTSFVVPNIGLHEETLLKEHLMPLIRLPDWNMIRQRPESLLRKPAEEGLYLDVERSKVELKTREDGWHTSGVEGIVYDDMGFAYLEVNGCFIPHPAKMALAKRIQ